MVLLLGIALIPIVISGVTYRLSMLRLGTHLAADTRRLLTDNARTHLQTLVFDYGRIVDRGKSAVEQTVRTQAAEVEARLAKAPPTSPRIFMSSDYDSGKNLPDDMALSPKQRIRVTYSDQVFFLAKGADRPAAGGEMARLSTMPRVYRELYDRNPDLVYWQYTSLESGLHSSYPGHGGYPSDYDPRERDWYTGAKKSGKLDWYIMPDVSTGTVTLCVSMPVRRPDKTFAGVTAIDVPLTGIIDLLILPEAWRPDAETMLVYPGRPGNKLEGKLAIIVQKSYHERKDHWKKSVDLQAPDSQDSDELAALTADIIAGKRGVRRMRYKGRDSLWAYGKRGEDQAAALVIVPYSQIITQARQAEQNAIDQMNSVLFLTGAAMFGFLVFVTIAAVLSARRVTQPVMQFIQAAGELAGGNFDARVDIKTGDELEDLGDIFNDMGPKLRERRRMKQSLETAMEIQQHLLPQDSPQVEGFDIAGKSIYCDETGGDYYDFIELAELGPGRIGIALGDVSGHGIGSALLMAAARSVLRSHAVRHGANLGELFETLNRHVMRDSGEGQFMTLFYAVLDAQRRSLVWTSGGHDPALWLQQADGEIRELPNTGVPLGIVEGASYEQAGPIELNSGDIVLVGTDGIWEARDPADEMFGKDRLREIMSASADRSATQIHDAIVDAVREHRQSRPQEDDVTLVVIKTL